MNVMSHCYGMMKQEYPNENVDSICVSVPFRSFQVQVSHLADVSEAQIYTSPFPPMQDIDLWHIGGQAVQLQ
jgi:hypothetical protein